MLTFADARQLTGFTVFRDVSWSAGARTLTSTFYALRDTPALAVADDGGPAYAFYWYRGAAPPDAGGLLTVGVTASPAPADHDRLVAEIQSAFALPAGAEVTLAPVPLDTGTVSLSFAAETGTGAANGLATAILGDGPARQTSTDTATFAVTLTADGAALLAQALDDGAGLLNAQFGLVVPYILDDVSLRVWCDVPSACRTAADLLAGGELSPAGLVSTLQAHQLTGTSWSSVRPLSGDEEKALNDLAAAVLTDLLPGALLDDTGKPRPYAPDLEQHLNLTLTATYPATRELNLGANLALPATPAIRASRVSVYDVAADPLLARIEVSAAGDMAAQGIADAGIRLDYHGTTAAGTPLSRTGEAVLRPASPAAVIAFDLATASQRTVQPHVDVHYADGSAPYSFDMAPLDEQVLVLDVDALGVLMVDVALGVVDPALDASAIVQFGYGTGTGWDATRVLDQSAPAGRWTAVVREPPGPYRWRVSWTAGPARLEGEWQTATRRSLVLDAPAGLTPPQAAVTCISAGDFSALAAVIIELRLSADAPVSVLQFTAADQSLTWTATEATAPLAYRVRQTTVLVTGAHVQGDWQDGNRSVLVVRDVLHFEVTLVARLLGLGTTARRAVIQIQGPDPATPSSTVVLSGPDDQPTCSLRLLDPADHQYRYRIILSSAAGPDRSSDWLSGSSSILVLRPPS